MDENNCNLTIKMIELSEKQQELNGKQLEYITRMNKSNSYQLLFFCISILVIVAIFCTSVCFMWNSAYNGESYDKNENINRNISE
jgi:hypothetical protein